LLAIFTFFSVSSTKLPTYIFPCFLSLALIVGRLWDEFLIRIEEKSTLPGMNASYYFLIVVMALSLVGGYIFLKLDSPDMLPGAVVSGVFLIFGMALSLAAFIIKKFLSAFMLIAYAVAIILLPIASLVLPEAEGYESSRPVSKVINKHYKKGDVICSEKDYRPGVAFYTGVIPAYVSNSRDLDQYITAGKTVWGVLKRRNIVDENKRVIYSCGKKRLVTNGKEAAK
jgi:4-amino-4-deoxy-L-arabinose transferase-like glycosyltransferase